MIASHAHLLLAPMPAVAPKFRAVAKR